MEYFNAGKGIFGYRIHILPAPEFLFITPSRRTACYEFYAKAQKGRDRKNKYYFKYLCIFRENLLVSFQLITSNANYLPIFAEL